MAFVPEYLFKAICGSQSQDRKRQTWHLGFQTERHSLQGCPSAGRALESDHSP